MEKLSDEFLKKLVDDNHPQYIIGGAGHIISDMATELLELRERTRWIPVEERLPEKETGDTGEEYLVYLDFQEIVIPAEFINGRWRSVNSSCDWTKRVTHWCNLPPAPERGE